jgi:hypothetical protein
MRGDIVLKYYNAVGDISEFRIFMNTSLSSN